jgi:hypothetical protein
MRATEKEDKLMWECYRELFAASSPPGDFDELVENATINERGQKEIPFMDYELEEDKMEAIIAKYTKKIKYKWRKTAFRNSILLGCSPKTKWTDS